MAALGLRAVSVGSAGHSECGNSGSTTRKSAMACASKRLTVAKLSMAALWELGENGATSSLLLVTGGDGAPVREWEASAWWS